MAGFGSSNYTGTRAPDVALEIKRGCQLSLEWDEMYARYMILLSTFKLEEQLFCSKT